MLPFLRRHVYRTILAALVILTTSTPGVAQITSTPALPVTRGHGIVRVQTKLLRATDTIGTTSRSLTVISAPVVGVYGVTPKLAVFGVVPILSKRLETTTPGSRVERNPAGLGDVRVFARYTAFQSNARGRTIRLAPFAGIEAPTGTNSAEDALGVLPAPLQLGSGSWDPFFGFAFTWETLGWQLNIAPAYQRNTTADGFRFGNQARIDAGYKVRVLPRALGGGIPRFLYANLESNLIHARPNETGDGTVVGSGGTTWYLGPGVQFITQRYIVEGAIQLPILQDLGVGALPRDYVATLSARLNL